MTKQRKVKLHCWECGPRTDDDCGTTCMLEHDHEGPHEWARNDEIRIAFAPFKPRKRP